jgi:hypothetical protein
MFGTDKDGILASCGKAVISKKISLLTTSLGSKAGDKTRVTTALV